MGDQGDERPGRDVCCPPIDEAINHVGSFFSTTSRPGLQLHEFHCRGLGLLGRKGNRSERLAHFPPDRLGIIQAGATEQREIKLAVAGDAFGWSNCGGKRLNLAGEILPASVFLRPRGAGEDHVGRFAQACRQKLPCTTRNPLVRGAGRSPLIQLDKYPPTIQPPLRFFSSGRSARINSS